MGEVTLRAGRHTSLQRLLVNIQALDPPTVTEACVQSLIENAASNWQKLQKAHETILTACADQVAATVQFNAFVPMEENYIKVKATLYELKSKLSSSSSTSPPTLTNLRLPQMTLPNFDGKYEDWPTFSDLFKASIHKNTALSGSHKLQFLKSCIQGDAASIVKSFTITDANYSEAWSLLGSQFDNKREIINSNFKKLIHQPLLKHESASALQEMLNITLESIRSLKVLGQETDKWDSLLVVTLVEKFDSGTKAEWARSLKGTSPSTFQEIQDFIIQHISTLHAKGSENSSVSRVSVESSDSSTKRINIHHTSLQPSCQHCKGTHQLFQCTNLKNMAPSQRCEIVKSLNLCLNCLRGGHSHKRCRSSSKCRRCNKPHNTFLHFDQLPHPTHSPPKHSSTVEQSSNNHQQQSVNPQIASSSHSLTVPQSSSYHQQQSLSQQNASSHSSTYHQQQSVNQQSASLSTDQQHINNN